ncbi:MAG: HlyC/CorC family transporter [Candidatus Krumholzibacteriota bacterium]|nr:HlyC/CorC family transporter [Candidatus Krumholzibacteriota bacterium]
MRLEILPVLILILYISAQFVIAGAVASFSIISRMHSDRLFPKNGKGTGCPRLMHSNRLHLILILAGLEIVMVIFAVLGLPGIIAGIIHTKDGTLTSPGVLSYIISAIASLSSFTAGAGVASKDPVRVAYLVSYPVFPLIMALRLITVLFLKVIGSIFPDLPREMASLVFLFPDPQESSDGFIEKNGSMLMHSIVEFGEKKTREVMVPRIDVFSLDCHLDLDEIREKVSEAGHSRVPFYENSIDRIIGILCVKDLVRISEGGYNNRSLKNLLREPYFVPEGKKIDDLLREFQKEKKHLAIVVDEYGGTAGIVTLEDILEEIVGEIIDEHDHEEPLIRKGGEGEYLIGGRINLDDLEEELGISLPSEEVDTLGGFLFDLIGKVPEEGEMIEYEGIDFRIKRLDGQRIVDVSVKLPKQ